MTERPKLRRSLREATLIFLLGVTLGLVFNAASPRGIDLLRHEQQSMSFADTSQQSATRHSPRPTFIDLEEALTIFQQRNGLFIDVRHEEEFNEGHIKGAISLPLKRLETNRDLLRGIPKDTLIVTYCSGEQCAQSIDLGERLALLGFTNVKVFFSGWLQWQKRDLPIETGPGGG
jgi:rhodanese-related sulfurtransferase